MFIPKYRIAFRNWSVCLLRLSHAGSLLCLCDSSCHLITSFLNCRYLVRSTAGNPIYLSCCWGLSPGFSFGYSFNFILNIKLNLHIVGNSCSKSDPCFFFFPVWVGMMIIISTILINIRAVVILLFLIRVEKASAEVWFIAKISSHYWWLALLFTFCNHLWY